MLGNNQHNVVKMLEYGKYTWTDMERNTDATERLFYAKEKEIKK